MGALAPLVVALIVALVVVLVKSLRRPKNTSSLVLGMNAVGSQQPTSGLGIRPTLVVPSFKKPSNKSKKGLALSPECGIM